MESIIKANVLEHLTSNNLQRSHLFGFLRGHSCITQLLYVMDILTKSLDQGVPVDNVYMDLQKALILCRTNIYLNIMKLQASFSDGLLDFYLRNTRQCVVLKGKSSWQDVKSSASQGPI